MSRSGGPAAVCPDPAAVCPVRICRAWFLLSCHHGMLSGPDLPPFCCLFCRVIRGGRRHAILARLVSVVPDLPGVCFPGMLPVPRHVCRGRIVSY